MKNQHNYVELDEKSKSYLDSDSLDSESLSNKEDSEDKNRKMPARRDTSSASAVRNRKQ